MQRKHYATTITVILCGLLFIVIGSCFSAFLYQKEIVRVENPKILTAVGVNVYSQDGKTEINQLSLSKMNLGLKPATGEENVETNIPSTITDKQGSEGQYAKFKLKTTNNISVSITNIVIKTKHDQDKVEEERKNIMVAIEGVTKEAVSLENNSVNLGSIEQGEEVKEYTFYVWLNAKASDEIEGSIISFDISFSNIN